MNFEAEIGKPLRDTAVKRGNQIISFLLLIVGTFVVIALVSFLFEVIRKGEPPNRGERIVIIGEGSLPGELADNIIAQLETDDGGSDGIVGTAKRNPSGNSSRPRLRHELGGHSNDTVRGDYSQRPPDEEKDEHFHYADIADHILSKASFLVTIFSLFVIVVTLIVGIMGLKWFREYSELKKNVNDATEVSLQSLATIGLSIPPLKFTFIIPQAYEPTLRVIHENLTDTKTREKAIREPLLGGLLLLESLYLSLRGDFGGARRLLVDLTEYWWYPEDVKNSIRFRLAYEYVQAGMFVNAVNVAPDTWQELFKIRKNIGEYRGGKIDNNVFSANLYRLFKEYCLAKTEKPGQSRKEFIDDSDIKLLGPYPDSRIHQIYLLFEAVHVVAEKSIKEERNKNGGGEVTEEEVKERKRKMIIALSENLDVSIKNVINNQQTSPNVLAVWYLFLAKVLFSRYDNDAYNGRETNSRDEDKERIPVYIAQSHIARKEAAENGISYLFSTEKYKYVKISAFEAEITAFENTYLLKIRGG